jgi:protein-tyrosine phosphatase
VHWRASLVAALGLLALAGSRGVPLPERWTEARAGWLYRSAQIRAGDAEAVLRARRIDLVIDLTDEPWSAARDAEQRAARALGIRYLHAPVPPVHDVAVRSYATAVAAIAGAHARGERVLVHCKVGYRRSASAVALYARLVERAPAHAAYRELFRHADRSSRWQPAYIRFLERNLAEIRARSGPHAA